MNTQVTFRCCVFIGIAICELFLCTCVLSVQLVSIELKGCFFLPDQVCPALKMDQAKWEKIKNKKKIQVPVAQLILSYKVDPLHSVDV